MKTITTIFAFFIVSIPLIILCLVAHFISTVLGWTGWWYYIPFLFLFLSILYYINKELIGDT